MEIERKWLVAGFPKNWPHKTHCYIFQTYISSYNDCEIRVRYCEPAIDHKGKTISPYKFTYKSGGTLKRLEVEKELTASEFNELKQTVPYPAIFKDFYTFQFDGKSIEISRVDNNFYYAEVEFNNQLEAEAFEFPWSDLVIKEVTEDEKYKMKDYWRKSRIKEKI